MFQASAMVRAENHLRRNWENLDLESLSIEKCELQKIYDELVYLNKTLSTSSYNEKANLSRRMKQISASISKITRLMLEKRAMEELEERERESERISRNGMNLFKPN